MAKKKKASDKVLLANDHPKVESKEFEKSHAERILNRKNTGGWKLPENSDFKIEDKKLVGTIKGTSSENS